MNVKSVFIMRSCWEMGLRVKIMEVMERNQQFVKPQIVDHLWLCGFIDQYQKYYICPFNRLHNCVFMREKKNGKQRHWRLSDRRNWNQFALDRNTNKSVSFTNNFSVENYFFFYFVVFTLYDLHWNENVDIVRDLLHLL